MKNRTMHNCSAFTVRLGGYGDMKNLLKKCLLFPRRSLTAPIKLYRKHLSHLKGSPTCRFTPTCSEYAVEAIEEWGVLAGSLLALYRILRCNPFCKAGYDPVPKKKRR